MTKFARRVPGACGRKSSTRLQEASAAIVVPISHASSKPKKSDTWGPSRTIAASVNAAGPWLYNATLRGIAVVPTV